MDTSITVNMLYIGNNPDINGDLNQSLIENGIQTVFVNSEETGEEKLKSEHFDIIAIEHDGVVIKGLELVNKIKSDDHSPPVIMITGSGDEMIAAESLKSGASDYIVRDGQGGFFALLPTIITRALDNHQFLLEHLTSQVMLTAQAHDLKDFLDNAIELIMQCGPFGNIAYVNKSWQKKLGYNLQDVQTLHLPDIIHEDDKQMIEDRISYLQPGRGLENTEIKLLKKNGKHLYVSANITGRFKDGKLVGTRAIFNDITDRKMIESERESLIVELQDALENIKTLSGLLPICASCKKIRNDTGYWSEVETFISHNSDAAFTHSICPECTKKLYPDYYKKKIGDGGEKAEDPETPETTD